MRVTQEKNSFRRDFRRELKGRHRAVLSPKGELREVVKYLENDIPLPLKYHDHPLHHNWEGSRECHLKPDLLLVYTYIGDEILRLDRLGSHAEIFGL